MVYFTYLIARKLFNAKTGIVASILIATSGLSIYYSQEARMYSLAAFLVSILVYLFLEKKWVLFSFILILLAMTDYVSLLIIPIFWLVNLKDWKKITLVHIPMFAVLVLWFPVFQRQLTSGLSLRGSNWWSLLGPATFKNMALIPVKFVLGRISFDNKFLYVGIVVVVTILFGYILYLARKSSKLILFWLVLPIALGVLVSFVIPTLSYFRFIFCLPAFYILVAGGIQKLTKYKWLLFSVVIIINLLSSFYYLLNPKFQREDWRAAASAIGPDTIILPARSQSEVLEYYGKGSQIVYVGDFGGGQKEIWLSRYVWQVFDFNDNARKKIEDLGYNKTDELNFNGVVFYKYAHSN
jgi:hypothetical protein